MARATKTITPSLRRGSRGYWLDRAEQARALAPRLGEAEARENALAVARSYEVPAAHSDPETKAAQLTLRAKQAAERATQGEEHIAKQRALIATLKRDGHDVSDAEKLLRTFEETQVLHVEHRDRLQHDAAQAARANAGQHRGKAAPGLRPRGAGRHNPR